MKQTISAILLTMFFAVGCAQNPMTRFEYGSIRLDVGGRISRGAAVAMVDYQPGVYYAIDHAPKQIYIEVKLVELGRKDQEILGVDWFAGEGALIAASDIKNTTPQVSPAMAMGGLLKVASIGGRGGCPHGGAPGTCSQCSSDGGGTGINVPVVVGKKDEGSKKVTSVSATFDLDAAVDIDRSYVALEIKVGVDADGKIIVQPILLPVIVLRKGEPPAPTVRQVTTTALLRDGPTLVIGGLVEGETENDVKKKVPIFGDLPFLGNLFKSRGTTNRRNELLIFVTPRIIVDGGA